jgi:hypothetical protein
VAVVYRKGELSKGTMDLQWPHQVALPASRCTAGNYITIRLFCERLSLCPRTHSFRRHDTDMRVFCFAQRSYAEQFRHRFGGGFIDPKLQTMQAGSPALCWMWRAVPSWREPARSIITTLVDARVRDQFARGRFSSVRQFAGSGVD